MNLSTTNLLVWKHVYKKNDYTVTENHTGRHVDSMLFVNPRAALNMLLVIPRATYLKNRDTCNMRTICLYYDLLFLQIYQQYHNNA
jgi:hypothetical protein